MDIDTTQLQKVIMEDIIHKQVAPNLEKEIREQLVKELKKLGINQRKFGRERGNSKVALVEGNDFRRRIGTLDVNSIQKNLEETIRVTLKGLQDRRGNMAISKQAVEKIIRQALKR